MNDAGYTLTETLAAMAVIGLGLGGFGLGMQVHAAQQSAVGAAVLQAQTPRAVEQWLEVRLEEGAPFPARDGERLMGDRSGFQFDCDGETTCSARLEGEGGRRTLRLDDGREAPRVYRLTGKQDLRFVYDAGGGVIDQWPPSSEGDRRSLRSVSLIEGAPSSGAPILVARIHAEQPQDCRFDPIAQDCR